MLHANAVADAVWGQWDINCMLYLMLERLLLQKIHLDVMS